MVFFYPNKPTFLFWNNFRTLKGGDESAVYAAEFTPDGSLVNISQFSFLCKNYDWIEIYFMTTNREPLIFYMT